MFFRLNIHLTFFAFLLLFATSALANCPDIPSSTAQVQIDSLSAAIAEHNRRYYIEHNPIISDAEYDRLFAELVKLEGCFPTLASPDSPTLKIGAASTARDATIPRQQPMLSLSSAADGSTIETLLRRVAEHNEHTEFLVQPKVDGLPVELIYQEGKLFSAATRGDGRSGEDVTQRARMIHDIPQVLSKPFPSRLIVRGEIYADRRKIAAPLEEKYASPRHLAAGTLQARDPDPHALATLRFFPFELVDADQIGNLRLDSVALHYLRVRGFPIPAEHSSPAQSITDIRASYHGYLNRRETLPFAADGIVVKVDNLALRKKLGTTSRAPRWAAAWKFPPTTAQTTVESINWSVGRTGKRTPVAQLEPVRINGSLITRTSLHNASEVARLGIAPGDQVIVALAGDTIPQIIKVVGKQPRPTESTESEVTPIDACLSVTPGCEEQFLARAVYFVGKSGLNIKGLGKKSLSALISAGLIEDLPSIFELRQEEIASLPGFGKRRAENLVTSIRAVGKPQFAEILNACGIPGIGRVTATRIATHFTSYDALVSAGAAQLQSVPGIGVTTANNIRNFFMSPGGKKLVNRLREVGLL